MDNEMRDRMVLGTAQLGMDYGIANRLGRPSRKEALKILEKAWYGDIRCFDTAPVYKCESIIGDFVKAHGLEGEARILTKIPAIAEQSNWKDFIHSTINNSLNNLGCRSIEVLFFHKANDSKLLVKAPGFFKSLSVEYPVSNLGVSVYSLEEVDRLKGCEFDLAFQFPYNFLDKRFETNNISKGKRYARSIFLQGMLASNTDLRDNSPEELKKIHRKIHDFFARKKIVALNYAVQFAANSKCLDYFLFGVDTKEQLEQILSVDLQSYTPDDELNQLVSGIDKDWFDPRKWS